MLSLPEISDRLEIQDLMVRYSHAVDTGQWDLLDDIFTEDAHIDYTAMGGPAGDVAATKKFLAAMLPNFPAFQHLISNSSITLDGDTATGADHVSQPDDAVGWRWFAQPHAVRAVVPRHVRTGRRAVAHRAPGRGEELHVSRPGGAGRELNALRPSRYQPTIGSPRSAESSHSASCMTPVTSS